MPKVTRAPPYSARFDCLNHCDGPYGYGGIGPKPLKMAYFFSLGTYFRRKWCAERVGVYVDEVVVLVAGVVVVVVLRRVVTVRA